jgi:TonB family protein
MNAVLLYYIKVNLALALFYGAYRILFRNDTFFQLRRYTLLGMYLVAFLYPATDISGWLSRQSCLEDVVSYYASIIRPAVYEKEAIEVSLTGEESAGEMPATATEHWTATGGRGLSLLYGTGVALLSFRCLMELTAIFRTRFRCRKKRIEGIPVYILPKPGEPYSFLQWIFIHTPSYTPRLLKEILAHEVTHVRQYHSIDVILGECIAVACWMNPFAWLLKQEISINHEHIADRQVIRSGYDKKTYQYHLLRLVHLPPAAAKLYNRFSMLPLKKRITMLNKRRTNSAKAIKYLALIPLASGLLILSNIDAMARIAPEKPAQDAVETIAPAAIPVPPDDEVYTVVDKMPQFPGGENELFKFIARGIKYPVEAQEKGLQGRVIVSFIVEKDGSLSDIKVMREGDPVLGQEAVRVIRSMPKWTPGETKSQPVRVRYTLPVEFRLVPPGASTETPPPPPPVSSTDKAGVTVVGYAKTPQEKSDSEDHNEVFTVVEKMPRFPGGEKALFDFINSHIQYPKEAKEKGIQGIVVVSYIVEKDGSLTHFNIVRGVDPALDQEAVRILKSMPVWEPGEQKGLKVRVKYTMPFKFKF